MLVETYAPLHGEPFRIRVNKASFGRVLARYRKLYPKDTRQFAEMSSDIQHAIIRVAVPKRPARAIGGSEK